MTAALTLHFDFLPPPELRGNSRAHWTVRHTATRDLREATWVRIMEQNEHPFRMEDRIAVTYKQWWCGKPLDRDNFIKGMKPVLDEVCEWIGIDDSPDHVVSIDVEYERVKHRTDVACSITIKESHDNE